MTYPFVPAGSYRTGRARTIRLLVVHATQSPCAGFADNIANYFAGGPGVSSHYVCDDVTTIQCVRDEDTAFCAPNANADGLHVEQCGYSEWSRNEWLSGPPAQMLEEQVAPLLRHLIVKHGIPPRWLTPAEVAAGHAGMCVHFDVTQAYPGTGSHWDCGGGYPKDRVLELVTGGPLQPAAPAKPNPRRRPTVIQATLRPDAGWTYDVALPGEGDKVPNQADNGPTVVASTLVVRQLGGPTGVPANITVVWGSGKTSAARQVGGSGEVCRFPCPYGGLASVVSDRPLSVHGEVYTT